MHQFQSQEAYAELRDIRHTHGDAMRTAASLHRVDETRRAFGETAAAREARVKAETSLDEFGR
jgi:hypothetical protein